MTKKEIKMKIYQLESEKFNIQSYSNIKGYTELRDKLQKMKDDYDKQIQPTLIKMRDEIRALKVEYKKPTKKKGVIPQNLVNWLWKWKSGVDFGYYDPYIKWISPDEKYVIITTPGSTCGQGTVMGTGGYYYGSTSHYLVKVIEGAQWLDHKNSKIAEHNGRLSKEKFNEWMKLLTEIEKDGISNS